MLNNVQVVSKTKTARLTSSDFYSPLLITDDSK